jgi:CRISPR system Cascade subunit CasA
MVAGEAVSLIDRPWLPVRRADGTSLHIRPAEITSEIATNPIVAIEWSRPDFDAAAREFLIGLLATAFPTRRGDEWHEWFDRPPEPHLLDEAFAPLRSAFLVDGPGPRFLQDLDDLEGEEVPVSQLLIDSPGANALKKNLDHFVRRGRIERLSRAAAAMALFTLQAYAPTGGAGHRTSLRGGGPLTTLVLPGAAEAGAQIPLWQTLWLNATVDQVNKEQEVPITRVFPWLAATRTSSNDEATTPEDAHPLQAFWGMPRRIRLTCEPNPQGLPCDLTGRVDSVIVRSYRTRPYGAKYVAFRHPLSPYYRQKTTDVEWLPVHGQPGRVGYRHWIGLVESAQDNLRVPAGSVVAATKRLQLQGAGVRRNARLTAAGYDMDNMKARDFIESQMPLRLVDPNVAAGFAEVVRSVVGGAREGAALLNRHVRDALFGRNGAADATALATARNRFWEETEAPFHRLLSALADKLEDAQGNEAASREVNVGARQDWLAILKAHVLVIFDASAPLLDGSSIAQVERIVGDRRSLTLALNGYGKAGVPLYSALGLAPPESRKKVAKGGKR